MQEDEGGLAASLLFVVDDYIVDFDELAIRVSQVGLGDGVFEGRNGNEKRSHAGEQDENDEGDEESFFPAFHEEVSSE
jgi:hypothetical protein